MNKRLPLIAVGVVLLIALAGGAFVLSKNSAKTADQTGTPATQEQDSNQKSLKELLSSGTSQKCTFEDKDESVDIGGTTYISNGRLRGDFQSTVDGQAYNSHMIVDKDVFYTWTDGQATGFKMSLAGYDSADAQAQNVDLNKVADYNCSPWLEDSSLFSLPQNVNFTDTGAYTSPSTQSGDKCAVCDNVPAASQAQCKAALNC